MYCIQGTKNNAQSLGIDGEKQIGSNLVRLEVNVIIANLEMHPEHIYQRNEISRIPQRAHQQLGEISLSKARETE